MRAIDLDAERTFENSKVNDANVRAAQDKYYWATQLSREAHDRYVCDQINDQQVLEIGCSSGYDADQYSRHCRNYTGIDISDDAIAAAEARNIANATFICVDGHHLPFPDASFDSVIVNSLLHHLDLPRSFSEICRVLRPNGQLLFREPLGTNPLIQAYRAMTPQARTRDERPFTRADLALMKKHFTLTEVRWYGMTALVAAWVQVPALRRALTRIDGALSKTPARIFFWQFCGAARKLDRSLN